MKNVLFQLLVSLRRIIYLTLGGFDRLMRRQNRLFILSYHSVARDDWRFSVDFSMFKRQVLWLKKRYEIVSLSEVGDYLAGKKILKKSSVVITFDDGYRDVLQTKEFFSKHGIKPAIFLLSDTAHANHGELATKRDFLQKREILSLMKAGWEIGCHSATHANLASLSQGDVRKEVIVSKKLLEEKLGVSIPYFAYPRGKYSDFVLACVKKAKYQLALTMDDGFITKKANPYVLPRVGVDGTHSFSEFCVSFSPSVVRFRKLIKSSFLGKYL